MLDKNTMKFEVMAGEEDFKVLRDHCIAYVDKTSFIEKLFAAPVRNGNRSGSTNTAAGKVTLITRPRRFGKSLTLSMLKYFLEMNYQNPGDKSEAEKLFKGLAISENEDFCQRYMSEYPVILISLKGVDGDTFTDALSRLLSKVKELYSNFKFLMDSDALDEDEKEEFRFFCKFSSISVSNLCKPEDEYKAKAIISESISNLTRFLNKVYP